jgi:hypothetical protein
MKKLVNLSAKGMENQDRIHENTTCVSQRERQQYITFSYFPSPQLSPPCIRSRRLFA